MKPSATKSVLLMTLPPVMGGVTAMGRLSAAVLRKHGHLVTTAWRAYYADAPALSVRPWQSLSRRPTMDDASDAAG